MKIINILGFSLFLTISNTLFAETYYVCNVGGNDGNNGTSIATPFETFDKAREKFETMNGGDSVLLCRGGVFPTGAGQGAKSIDNYSCSAELGKQCTMSDYGDPTLRRPLIQVSNGYGLNFEDGGPPNADGGYIISNLILMLVEAEGFTAGIRFYNDVNDVVLDNLHIEGFSIGVTSAGANPLPQPGADREQNRITLRNSVIINNESQGWLGGCDDCVIENNYFENNGFARARLDHNIYLASSADLAVNNMIVRGNTLYKSTHIDGQCQGVSLVAHGEFDGLVIEDNLIKEDVGAVTHFCWGISVDPGYVKEETFKNIIIRNNRLMNVGNVGIGCASCDGVLIEGNVLIDQASVLTHGVRVPVRAEDSLKSKNVTIRGNDIILSHEGAVGVTVGGVNPFIVSQNMISQPTTTNADSCFIKTDANANTDTTNNTCNRHTEIVMNDGNVGPVVDAQATADAQAAAQAQATADAQAAAQAQATADAQAAAQAQATADAQAAAQAQATADAQAAAQAQATADAQAAAQAQATADAQAAAAQAQATADVQATKQAEQVAQPEQAASTQVAEAAATAEPIKVKDVKQQSSSSSGGSSAGGSSAGGGSAGGGSASGSSAGGSEAIKTDSDNVLAYIGSENAPVVDTVLSLEPTITADTGYTSMNPVVSTELAVGDKKILVLKGVVTQSGVIQAMRTDYSQVDSRECRASAKGRCLLF
jgi:hypothetical protein